RHRRPVLRGLPLRRPPLRPPDRGPRHERPEARAGRRARLLRALVPPQRHHPRAGGRRGGGRGDGPPARGLRRVASARGRGRGACRAARAPDGPPGAPGRQARRHPPARERLVKAKTYLRGQFPLRIESPDALAARLGEAEFNALGPEELSTYRERVAAVTPEQAAEVAARLMPPPEAVAIVVVGKAAEIRDALAARFGPLETMAARDCEKLSAAKR